MMAVYNQHFNREVMERKMNYAAVKRQIKLAKKDMARWPAWMKKAGKI